MITFIIGLVLWVATAVAWWHCLCDLAAYDKFQNKKNKKGEKE